jgi:hypothetical protein
MSDLAKRGPLGLKQPKPAKKPRKAVRKISAKRQAYLDSPERQTGFAHMARVKLLPCICCGHPQPSIAHHVTGDGKPRNDMRVIPLCEPCHVGQNGYHRAKKSWVEKYGQDYLLLDRVADLLRQQDPHDILGDG